VFLSSPWDSAFFSHFFFLSLPLLPSVLSVQPDALACGKTAEELKSDNVSEKLIAHKVRSRSPSPLFFPLFFPRLISSLFFYCFFFFLLLR
jgi:hypothetical protein